MNLHQLRSKRLVGSVILLLAMLVSGPAWGQKFAAKVAPKPFEPGEELTYKAEVSRSLLRKVDVATFKFNTNLDPSSEKAKAPDDSAPYALKFIGDVASEGFFTRLFDIRFHQHVESTVDGESLAVRKTEKIDEQGKRKRISEANFDQENGKVTWTEHDPNDPARPSRTNTSDFTGPVFDVVSAIYYLRTQPLDVGKTFEVPISDSGRVFRVSVRVTEKKRMKTALGRVSVVRVDPELFGERGMVKGKGQFSVWLTDDQKHIPVAAQIKTEYGTFDITLKKVSNQPR